MDSSFLKINNEVETIVTALFSSAIPESGKAGDLVIILNARDEDATNQVSTQNHAVWSSPEIWTESGSIGLNSTFVLEDGGQINWNTLNTFDYKEHNYSLRSINLNLNGVDNFLCLANGEFGGKPLGW